MSILQCLIVIAHGQTWNFCRFQLQKLAHPSGINLQLAAETGEFSQVRGTKLEKISSDTH